jgi:hypothetical protein
MNIFTGIQHLIRHALHRASGRAAKFERSAANHLLQAGVDVYTFAARILFQKVDVSADERDKAKQIVYALGYGADAVTVAVKEGVMPVRVRQIKERLEAWG